MNCGYRKKFYYSMHITATIKQTCCFCIDASKRVVVGNGSGSGGDVALVTRCKLHARSLDHWFYVLYDAVACATSFYDLICFSAVKCVWMYTFHWNARTHTQTSTKLSFLVVQIDLQIQTSLDSFLLLHGKSNHQLQCVFRIDLSNVDEMCFQSYTHT